MPSTPDFLSLLNSSQRQAVQHYCGPLLVVAGAGSGKTRALTYRIANLVLTHRVAPENLLAVTFTNKAAREMKERIEKLFAERTAQEKYGKPLEELAKHEQTKLRSQVYKTITKDLWVGTFHSLCARILRFEIEKYQDSKGRRWQSTFSIFDESDVQSLIKEIVIHQLNLDERKFEPRSVRYAISNAKNQGWSPQDLEREQPNFRGRVIASVYSAYQDALAANNGLDFDDLILVLVQLLQQNEQVLAYWHQRFHHILVDEYQDTNRTQYDLIRLLTTNGTEPQAFKSWAEQNRSVFVVGDVDQSIYSFRAADFKILLDFQQDFGDRLPDDDTRTMVKLEENYRSTENILAAANHLIDNNTERIDKILKPTRPAGAPIQCQRADDEIREAEFVVDQIRSLEQQQELNWGNFAILYRTNAQSRPFEEVLVRWGVPYTVVGGLKFYDRREIKDVIAYLRLIINPADTVSLKRVINTPRRGIGKTTVDRLVQAAQELGVPLWEIIRDETSVKTLAGRSARPIVKFAQMIEDLQAQASSVSASALVQEVLQLSGYTQDLQDQSTDEAEERLANVQELYNAVLQFEEENLEATLNQFLESAALASDLDNLGEGQTAVSLMTLHSSKGLEFPVVFLVGLEQGLFPNFRSLDDPAALEEERRLCYVGITRAQEQLFMTHTRERRLYGSREPASPSCFLEELPKQLLIGNGAGAGQRKTKRAAAKQPFQPALAKASSAPTGDWQVGDRTIHPEFGPGQITHVFGKDDKICLAIKFPNQGQKIIDPRAIALQRVQ
ncbi:MAG: DNA helicase PcrA [Aphanocapsa sp. GSE-SYN-MK-11-07L]|jgi:DNA helicase-2/ATP-dependent DNA helicase PcrA|nr:DNA helicase PcrA [Aphanocapsa sp. GSE-SYN-MK-11-07L]